MRDPQIAWLLVLVLAIVGSAHVVAELCGR